MKTPKFAFVIGTMSFLVVSPMAVGMPGQIIEAETLSNKTPSLEQSGQPTIVAKNEQKTSNSNRKPQSDSQNQTMESDAAVKEKKGNTESEASNKPLKPFKPSEEIAAEQAVDFPVDI